MDPDEMQLVELDEEENQPRDVVYEIEEEQARKGQFTRVSNITVLEERRARKASLAEKARVSEAAAIPLYQIGNKPMQPVYEKHPICGHDLDDIIKYKSRPTHAVLDEKTGYARYNELVPCPHCTDEIRRRRNARIAAANIAKYFGGANIPSYAEDWNFSTVPPQVDADAVDAMIDYTETSIEKMGRGKAGINIFLDGVPGSGKTSLAISAMHMFMEAGIACYLVYMTEYFMLVYRGMNKYAPPELTKLEESAMNVPVLVMDDFSSENPTQDTLKRILLMIEYRTARGLTTLITSNNTIEVLENHWYLPSLGEEVQQQSGRIIRRLRERFKVVHVQPWGANPRH